MLGDWNRRPGVGGDRFWPEIADSTPANAKLRPGDAGTGPKRNPRYDIFIADIVLDRRAGADMLSFTETLYGAATEHYSDHCPISVTLVR